MIGIHLDIPDPVGSTANDQELYAVYDESSLGPTGIFLLKSNTGNDILTYFGAFSCDTEAPSGAAQQHNILSGLSEIFCNYDHPIYFRYKNDTDANQTGTRTIKVLVKIYDEVI